MSGKLRSQRQSRHEKPSLTKCKVHVDLGLHFYWLAIQRKRLVLPCLHCVNCSLLQRRWPLTDTKIFHVSGVRDRCFEYNTSFDMSLLRIRGVLGIFPLDFVSGYHPSRYSYLFVRSLGWRPARSRTSNRRRHWSGGQIGILGQNYHRSRRQKQH